MADNKVNDGINDMAESVKKLFLASVGVVALSAEKTTEVMNDLVEKGKITVEQGKELNQELTRKVKETFDATSDEALKARLKNMTAEERAAYAAKVASMAADLDAETVEVEVEDAEPADDGDAE